VIRPQKIAGGPPVGARARPTASKKRARRPDWKRKRNPGTCPGLRSHHPGYRFLTQLLPPTPSGCVRTGEQGPARAGVTGLLSTRCFLPRRGPAHGLRSGGDKDRRNCFPKRRRMSADSRRRVAAVEMMSTISLKARHRPRPAGPRSPRSRRRIGGTNDLGHPSRSRSVRMPSRIAASSRMANDQRGRYWRRRPAGVEWDGRGVIDRILAVGTVTDKPSRPRHWKRIAMPWFEDAARRLDDRPAPIQGHAQSGAPARGDETP